MSIMIDITGAIKMNRTLDNIRIAMAIVAIFVFMGFVFAGFWHLVEIVTNYTANIFTLAGY